MKANEKKYNFLTTETTFQHVSTSKFSCTLFIFTNGTDIFTNDTIGALAADTVQGSMVANGTNGNQWHQWQNHQWYHWEYLEHSPCYFISVLFTVDTLDVYLFN